MSDVTLTRAEQEAQQERDACPICRCACWADDGLWELKDQEELLRRLKKDRPQAGCPLCGCDLYEDEFAAAWESFSAVVLEHVTRRRRREVQVAALAILDRAIAK